MANVDRPRILILLARNPKHQDLVDFTITKVWRTGKHSDPGGKKVHRELKREGSFVHPEPVRDVRVVVHELGTSLEAQSHGAGPSTPGRERSGFENVPLPLQPQPELPPEPTATTPLEAPSTAPAGDEGE